MPMPKRYESSIEQAEDQDIVWTLTRTCQILEEHGHGPDERWNFFKEVGFEPTYKAADVLRWLGY